MESTKPSKREVLKRMIGQARLMEIIDRAYDGADACPNCRALRDWWEESGAEIPTPGVISNVRRTKAR